MRCDLIVKRTQTKPPRPIFTSTVVANMDDEFVKAANDYGKWKDVVYSDQEIDVRRGRDIEKAERKRRRGIRFANSEVGGVILLLLWPGILIWWIVSLPFKILFWFRRAKKTADTQQCRFNELQKGKSFNSADLGQVLNIEDEIINRAVAIAEYIKVATSHDGDIIFIDRP